MIITVVLSLLRYWKFIFKVKIDHNNEHNIKNILLMIFIWRKSKVREWLKFYLNNQNLFKQGIKVYFIIIGKESRLNEEKKPSQKICHSFKSKAEGMTRKTKRVTSTIYNICSYLHLAKTWPWISQSKPACGSDIKSSPVLMGNSFSNSIWGVSVSVQESTCSPSSQTVVEAELWRSCFTHTHTHKNIQLYKCV